MPSRLVPGKFKRGQLHSGSKTGPVVTSRKQELAIYESERRNEQEHGSADAPRGKKPHRSKR